MPPHNFGFYTEVVVVTILSFVAANSWKEWLSKTLNTYIGDSLIVDFIAALLMTALAIALLNVVFPKKKKDKEIKSYYHHGLHESSYSGE